MPSKKCLELDLLERYALDGCAADERTQVEQHIALCATCRKALAEQRANEDFLHEAAGLLRELAQSGLAAANDEPPLEQPDQAASIHSWITEALADYDIKAELERGGQAVVYRALQKATHREVAIKVLAQGPHATPQQQRRFEREVDLASNLQHPNIVTIFDSGLAHGQHYFVMEYITGMPLDAYVRENKLTLTDILKLAAKISAAVAHAHHKGVMHRDLKPANILVDESGEPHVLDFGLAKGAETDAAMQPSQRASLTGQIVGTPAFMSPEQAEGDPLAIDIRTDVYSLGVLLYLLIAEKFPYQVNGAPLSVLYNIQQSPPASLTHPVRRCPTDLEAIIFKALAKQPQRRYHSAAELQADLQRFLQGLPVEAKGLSSTYLLRKLISRHRYTSTVAALLIIIIAAFSYVSFDLYFDARQAQREFAATQNALTSETAANERLARQVTFNLFLQAFRSYRLAEAENLMQFLTPGSSQLAAARFLLDPRPVVEKESLLTTDALASSSGFAEFALAQAYLREGNDTQARDALQRCIAACPDDFQTDWFHRQAALTLQQLQEQAPPPEETP